MIQDDAALIVECPIDPTRAMLEQVEVFPRVYVSSVSAIGLLRNPAPGSRCRALVPETRASFQLRATNAQFGTLSVTLTTFDRLRNFPGSGLVELSSPVSLTNPNGVRINQPGGRSWVHFYGATVAGELRMDVAFSASYTAQSNGVTCWTGTNSMGRRRISMTQVGFVGDDDEFVASITSD